MDFLRLLLLLSLIVYGAIATDQARALLRSQRQTSAVTFGGLTHEDSIYIKHLTGLATVRPASILVQDGMLLGTGLDHHDQFDPTAHAETEAIRDACRRVKKMVLRDGVLYASRQPCQMCMQVIVQTGVTRVVVASGDSSARVIRVPEIIH